MSESDPQATAPPAPPQHAVPLPGNVIPLPLPVISVPQLDGSAPVPVPVAPHLPIIHDPSLYTPNSTPSPHHSNDPGFKDPHNRRELHPLSQEHVLLLVSWLCDTCPADPRCTYRYSGKHPSPKQWTYRKRGVKDHLKTEHRDFPMPLLLIHRYTSYTIQMIIAALDNRIRIKESIKSGNEPLQVVPRTSPRYVLAPPPESEPLMPPAPTILPPPPNNAVYPYPTPTPTPSGIPPATNPGTVTETPPGTEQGTGTGTGPGTGSSPAASAAAAVAAAVAAATAAAGTNPKPSLVSTPTPVVAPPVPGLVNFLQSPGPRHGLGITSTFSPHLGMKRGYAVSSGNTSLGPPRTRASLDLARFEHPAITPSSSDYQTPKKPRRSQPMVVATPPDHDPQVQSLISTLLHKENVSPAPHNNNTLTPTSMSSSRPLLPNVVPQPQHIMK